MEGLVCIQTNVLIESAVDQQLCGLESKMTVFVNGVWLLLWRERHNSLPQLKKNNLSFFGGCQLRRSTDLDVTFSYWDIKYVKKKKNKSYSRYKMTIISCLFWELKINHLLFHLRHRSSFCHQLTGWSGTDRSSGRIPVCSHTPGHNLRSGEGKRLRLKMQNEGISVTHVVSVDSLTLNSTDSCDRRMTIKRSRV